MKAYDKNEKAASEGFDEKAMKYRKLKIGTVATLITVGFVVAVIVFNVLLNILVDIYPIKLDVTTEKVYNLSTDAVSYLETIDKKIELILVQDMDKLESLFNQYLGTYYKTNYLTELFKNFDRYSDNITLENKDPVVEPTFFSERGITTSSTSILVVYCPETNRHKLISASDILVSDEENNNVSLDAERAITAAVIYVAKDEVRDICFLTGHEEDNDSAGQYLQEFFRTNGFNVNTVSLDQTDAFSEKTAALVIIAPQHDFSEEDIAALKAFMQNDNDKRQYNLGRTLYVFCDNYSPSMPNFYAFLREYCVVPVDEYVIDTSSAGSALFSYTSDGSTKNLTVISGQKPHEVIGANLTKKVILFEQYTKSFELLEIGEGEYISSVEPILTTTENSYTKPLTAESFNYDSATDRKASRTVGALSTRKFFNVDEQKTYTGYLAVMGSTAIISSSFMSSTTYDNSGYIKDLINATIGDDSIEIGVIPVDLSAETLTITSQTEYTLICVLLAAVPLAFAVCGIVVFAKRKHM